MSTSSRYASLSSSIIATLEDAEATSAQARSELRPSTWPPSDPSARPLDALAAISSARLSLEDAEHLAVALLRDGGTTWQEIADAIGMSRQAAHQRFRHDVV